MKKIMIICLIILTNVFSQDKELTRAMGLGAGMISGTGFSYRNLNERNGFQITFGIMKYGDEEDEEERYFSEGYSSVYDPSIWVPDTSRTYTQYDYDYGGLWGNVGLTYYKILHTGKKSYLYSLTGASMYYSSQNDYSREYRYTLLSDSTFSYDPVNERKELDEFNAIYFIGIGIGLEYELTENIKLSVELPLTFSSRGLITMFIPQAYLHYYFK